MPFSDKMWFIIHNSTNKKQYLLKTTEKTSKTGQKIPTDTNNFQIGDCLGSTGALF
jgi:hypothetical protein